MNVPAEAYATPSDDDRALNAEYWQGYDAGRSVAIAGPAGSSDYAAYRKLIDTVYLRVTAVYGWVIAFNVGRNAAIVDGANWLWMNDPDSPHRKPPV